MSAGACGGQKRALDFLELKLERVVYHQCGCWERNSGPLEEQYVLLTAEPAFQPWRFLFLKERHHCLKKGNLSHGLKSKEKLNIMIYNVCLEIKNVKVRDGH